ncbi:hypothetical protein [Bacillus infantis]|nr:hypothetical protein [Bacillus infantis]MCP1159401.1 hypothetical protein [Bacillus infantis]
MEELENDNCCLTCVFSVPINEDKYGNPQYVKCTKDNDFMSNDDICKRYA